jgi:sterol desaturase/sphingolipid hydroxylase (fatty acid hydroxylase superfamily)
MPSPIDILLDPLSLVILAMYTGLVTWEWIAPGRRDLPSIGGWRRRGLTSFAIFFMLSSYLPLIWDTHLARWQVVDLSGLGTLGGILAGLLVYELLAYWWHRAMHRFGWLWRGVHQMHHSAERLDTYGAFWFSPADMVGWTAVGSLSLVLLVGVTPQAATALLLIISFLGMFQHANIRTPRWLGYFVQRPESHSVHHGRGIHRYNYADVPLLDMLFGTFRNPRRFASHTGFYRGASNRVLDMLLGRDVTTRPAGGDEAPLGSTLSEPLI